MGVSNKEIRISEFPWSDGFSDAVSADLMGDIIVGAPPKMNPADQVVYNRGVVSGLRLIIDERTDRFNAKVEEELSNV